MPDSSRQRRSPGLLGKLALFFLAISLPALLLVELVVVLYEYNGLTRRIDSGLLREAVEDEAARLAPILVKERPITLEQALAAWVLRLERPRSLLGDQTAYVLLELARQPFSVAVIDRDGKPIVTAPETEPLWELDTIAFAREVEADLPSQELSRVSSEDYIRRYAAPIWFEREMHGWLLLEIRLNKPWRKMAADVTFEWPVIMASLILIALGAALFLRWTVTRRIDRIEFAADNWARGEFSRLIDDSSGDELGRLSRELDRMALSLRELLHTRGSLARMAERERLARDLHDTVKQQAFALHLKLAAAIKRLGDQAGPVQGELERARSLVHAMQTELAQILVGLKSDSEPQLPLSERLRAQLEAWTQISTVPARLRAQNEVVLSQPQQNELLRLVDEALANVLKHAKAEHVDVLLQRRGNRALLRLADNGQGLAAGRSSGMGMDTMRSRAAQLPEGQIKVVPGPAGGTVVEVSWSVLPTGGHSG